MSETPYTTVASDFLKKVTFIEDAKASEIDFAATDFATLRTALLNYIKAVYPLDYNNFSESDLGMMLVELVAYMGAVMSMKADMLAHESFLRTAKNPNNVRKLLQLIGINLKGPISAAAMSKISGTDPGPHTIPASARVVTKVSPEDGEQVSYTAYTTTNGKIDNPLSDGSIELTGTGTEWENIVLVEGSFATDEGTFSDVDVVKDITLQQAPVVEESIQVLIGDDIFTQVESILTVSSSDQKVFEVIYSDDYSAKIVFGDGVAGVNPTTGSDYKIMYRVGGGQRGNTKTGFISETITTSLDKELTLENIKPFTGGSNAETIDHAKKYGKLVFKQQDRLVSLEDYVAFCNTFTGPNSTLAKGVAVTREAFGSANIVDLYILEKASDTQLQKASIAFKESMLNEVEKKKMMTDEIVLVDGLIRTVDPIVEVSLDSKFSNLEPTISTKVTNVILDFFSVDNREFGESINMTALSKEIFTQVPEVRFAEVTNYQDTVRLEFNEILQLNNFTINFNYV